MDTSLYDENGKLIGVLYISDGGKRLYDPYGRFVGEYNARSDVTYSESGRYVGRGDLLTSLLAKR